MILHVLESHPDKTENLHIAWIKLICFMKAFQCIGIVSHCSINTPQVQVQFKIFGIQLYCFEVGS